MSGGHELGGYFARDVERTAYPVLRDTDSLGASYDRYLRNAVHVIQPILNSVSMSFCFRKMLFICNPMAHFISKLHLMVGETLLDPLLVD